MLIGIILIPPELSSIIGNGVTGGLGVIIGLGVTVGIGVTVGYCTVLGLGRVPPSIESVTILAMIKKYRVELSLVLRFKLVIANIV